MKYIDRSKCFNTTDESVEKDIKRSGDLTREATKIAEEKHLGVCKIWGNHYRIIEESGLVAYDEVLPSLAAVDEYLKHLDPHEDARDTH